VKIESFRPEHSAAFEALNRAWLVGNGLLEPADEPDLRDPNGTIIALGGQVYVAVENDVVIGTCGIVPHGPGPGEFEVRKLAVAASAQGRGIGMQLVEACLDFARQRGARRITLISNSSLVAALRLYERAGFRYAPLPANNPYATGDVHMVLDVQARQAVP
jgi:ribosomal protein S18 acetylase RimI-like enzyme